MMEARRGEPRASFATEETRWALPASWTPGLEKMQLSKLFAAVPSAQVLGAGRRGMGGACRPNWQGFPRNQRTLQKRGRYRL